MPEGDGLTAEGVGDWGVFSFGGTGDVDASLPKEAAPNVAGPTMVVGESESHVPDLRPDALYERLPA